MSPITINSGRRNSKKSSKKGSSFLSSLPRTLFRLLTYPAIIYIGTVYYTAKVKDPNGFQGIKDAFVFGKKEPEKGIELVGVDIEEKFEEEDEHWLPAYPKGEKNTNTLKTPSLVDDILNARRRLINSAIKCHRMQSFLGEESKNNLCYSNFSYYERALDQRLAQNALLYSVPLLEAFQKIQQTSNSHPVDPEYDNFIKQFDLVEQVDKDAGPEDLETSINEIRSSVISKLVADHNEILNESTDEKDPNSINSNGVAEDIHTRALTFINANYNILKDAGIKVDQKIVEELPSDLVTNIIKTKSK